MRVGIVIFEPELAVTYVQGFIAMMLYHELDHESAVLKTAGMLSKGLLKIHSHEFPLFSLLSSFL